MKKFVFLATAAAMLAGCSNDSFVGEDNTSPQPTSQEGAIKFSTVSKSITRADHVGADAAKLLNNKFVVTGVKGDGSNMSTVFDNYNVTWKENTAATTESNTSDWEYVGKTPAATSGIYDSGNTKQSIKYWDYTASQYDFVAYSTGNATEITTGDPSTGNVVISKINAENLTTAAYTLKGAADDLAKCYIADMVTAYKEDKLPTQPKFQDVVELKFRSLASKVRMAIYETIPGYSVKDVKFYNDNTTALSTGATATSATLFTTGTAAKDKFYTSGTYTVKFPTIGSSSIDNSDYNKAHVAFTADESGKDTKKEFSTLNYKEKQYKEKTNGNIWLGRTSATASFAGTSPYYQIAMPNEEGTVLELRVDYTLESIDGSGEEIKVHGATAYVPAVYAAWKPNYAYTYIFKISDNTNGWTSTVTTDPAGLYPITFDAVVVDSEEKTQSTITTVATPSITTYQKGHDITKNEDEYVATKGDIYVQVMQDGNLKSDLDYSGKLYSLSARTEPWTEAEVMDALNIQASSTGTAITGRNGLTLTNVTTPLGLTTIPGADGNNITVTAGQAAKFTPTAGTTYAYVYDTGTDNADTEYHTAVVLTTEPTGWPTGYYTDKACTTQAPSTYADDTYYQKYTNLNKVYGVKVIKVAAATPAP